MPLFRGQPPQATRPGPADLVDAPSVRVDGPRVVASVYRNRRGPEPALGELLEQRPHDPHDRYSAGAYLPAQPQILPPHTARRSLSPVEAAPLAGSTRWTGGSRRRRARPGSGTSPLHPDGYACGIDHHASAQPEHVTISVPAGSRATLLPQAMPRQFTTGSKLPEQPIAPPLEGRPTQHRLQCGRDWPQDDPAGGPGSAATSRTRATPPGGTDSPPCVFPAPWRCESRELACS